MTSGWRSCQYISSHWDACSNHLAISDSLTCMQSNLMRYTMVTCDEHTILPTVGKNHFAIFYDFCSNVLAEKWLVLSGLFDSPEALLWLTKPLGGQTYVPTPLSSDTPMFLQPMFLRPYVPTPLCSDTPMFLQPYTPTNPCELCSYTLMFRHPYVPTPLCSYTPMSLHSYM